MAKTAEPFVVGGAGACLASSIVHPIDLAKVRLQLFKTQFPGKPLPSFANIIFNMVKTDGIKSIYAGLSAALGRQCVYGTARIGLFKSATDYLQKENGGKPLSFGMKSLR
jgi:solute carrier family 25 oxoglutarate transporter 11